MDEPTEDPFLPVDHLLHAWLKMSEWAVIMQGLGELPAKVSLPIIGKLQALEASERRMLAEKVREEAATPKVRAA